MLSPDSITIMAELLNTLRASPTRDLRAAFEQLVARHAGVMRIRLRPADDGPAATAATALAPPGSELPEGPVPASTGTAGAAGTVAGDPAGTRSGGGRDCQRSTDAASASAAPSQAPSIVPVQWRDARFLLDAEPHMQDRAAVLRVLHAAVPVAACVLCAQGSEPASVAGFTRAPAAAGTVATPAVASASASAAVSASAASAMAPASTTSLPGEGPSELRPVLDSDRLVGSSVVMEALRREIDASAATHFAVLIEGESGVGKELVARQIHAASSRRRGPFVPVNCAAVVESLFESELFGIEEGVATGVRARRGKFEQANHGTLFLDEIAELPLPAQAKLLRVVQDFAIERVGSQAARRVDVRLIVATNRSLDLLVDAGQFRRDLYFRLRAIQMHVAPLRERREDIIEIADAYLRRCDPNRPPRLSRSAAGLLCLHHWPGNVRELERALEFALTRCGGSHREILPEHLAPDIGQPYRNVLLPADAARSDETLTSMKSRYARLKYEQYKGNKRRTCAALNISYHTLVSLLKQSTSHVNGVKVKLKAEMAGMKSGLKARMHPDRPAGHPAGHRGRTGDAGRPDTGVP